MLIDTSEGRLYAYTGGRAPTPGQPTVVFVHGVLNDHSVWALQSRYLAHHGWNVLAIDLPGHARSAGNAPASVADGARAVIALLDALATPQAALVGHSWGSLIALQAAATLGARASHLALVGTAAPMRVAPALQQAAVQDSERAMRMVAVYSRSTLAPPPSVLGPGTWTFGVNLALQRRVLASNPQVNLFAQGFAACDAYADGPTAMARVRAPVLFALGALDQMTPPRAAQPLIDAARARADGARTLVQHLPCGHNLMTEAPDALLAALRDFLH